MAFPRSTKFSQILILVVAEQMLQTYVYLYAWVSGSSAYFVQDAISTGWLYHTPLKRLWPGNVTATQSVIRCILTTLICRLVAFILAGYYTKLAASCDMYIHTYICALMKPFCIHYHQTGHNFEAQRVFLLFQTILGYSYADGWYTVHFKIHMVIQI